MRLFRSGSSRLGFRAHAFGTTFCAFLDELQREEATGKIEQEDSETAQTLAARRELTAEEQGELRKLRKKLVSLYHPDRFAHEPDKLATYEKLTAAINGAKDRGDLGTLRQIAGDPHGFIVRQGWASLDFR